jgi:hypothetical protein
VGVKWVVYATTELKINSRERDQRDEGKEEQYSRIVEGREERGQLQPWFLFTSDPNTGCHL